jgi:group I intron endonuclease
MPDYSKGKIYTIRCYENPSIIYVGSTTQQLSQRWTDHKSRCNNEESKEYNRILYKKMRELGQDNFYIELYEYYPCEKKDQLNKKEGQVMRETHSTLNQLVAGRTNQEYRNENKEKIKNLSKTYTENNKEKIKEYHSAIFLCECGCSITKGSIAKHNRTQKHIKLMNIQNQELN